MSKSPALQPFFPRHSSLSHLPALASVGDLLWRASVKQYFAVVGMIGEWFEGSVNEFGKKRGGFGHFVGCQDGESEV